MLIAVSALFAGCKDDDGFILPYNLRIEDSTVQSGERLNIQGQGFLPGDALVFEGLKVKGDAIGRTDFILAAIALANRLAVVKLAEELLAQFV